MASCLQLIVIASGSFVGKRLSRFRPNPAAQTAIGSSRTPSRNGADPYRTDGPYGRRRDCDARHAFFDGAASERSFHNGQAASFRSHCVLTNAGDHICCRRTALANCVEGQRPGQRSHKASCAETSAANRSINAEGGDSERSGCVCVVTFAIRKRTSRQPPKPAVRRRRLTRL